MPSPKIAALILAAGKGTRMKSERPKVLHAVGGAPLVAYPVALAGGLGAAPIVVVVGHGAAAVEAEVERRFPGRCRFRLQAEQRGTGHAVMEGMAALEGFEGLVYVLSGDVPLLRAETLARVGEAMAGTPMVVVTMEPPSPTGYGRIVREGGRFARIVEEKDARPEERAIREVNAGVYAFDAAFLRRGLGKLGTDNAQGEYYLTDLVAFAAAEGGAETVVVDPEEVLGANDRAQLAELDALLRGRTLGALMREGVTIIDPATTYVDVGVEVGRDSTLYPNVHLRGRTKVGARTSIDTGAVLTDATVGDDVAIHAYSVLEGAEVAAHASVGPFARLRPGAKLAEESKVGNFVELKNTTLGRHAKANHLAYLGDAEIGADANVGAGTITCNYDGYGKYKTAIGDRVFVGSNSTLVAPIAIGDDAYVAAGSVLTEDVAEGGLAFGRARQIEKPGRARALRAEAAAKAAAAKKAKG